MFNLSDTCKRIAVSYAVCAAIIGIIGAAVIFMGYYKEPIAYYAIGLIFAAIFTFFKLVLLERSVNKAVDLNPADSGNYMKLHYMQRYFLTGAVVLVGVFVDAVSLFGVVLGLAALTPAVFIAGKLENAAKENKRKQPEQISR